MAVKLRFGDVTTPTPGLVTLRFGAHDTPLGYLGTLSAALPPPALALGLTAVGEVAAPVITGTLAATLPPPTLSLTLDALVERPTIVGELAATLPPAVPGLTLAASARCVFSGAAVATLPPAIPAAALGLDAAMVLDLDLPDADGARSTARHAHGLRAAIPLAARSQQMAAASLPCAVDHSTAAPLASRAAVRHQEALRAARHGAIGHAHGLRLWHANTLPHAEAQRTRRRLSADHAAALPLAHGTAIPHAERIRIRRSLAARHAHGLDMAMGASVGHAHGLPVAVPAIVGQQQMIPLPVGMWRPTPVDPDNPYSSPVRMRFCRLDDGTARLVFGCTPDRPPTTVIVPVRRTYIVLNNVSLRRVSNNLQLPAISLQIDIDADSWGWGWSASLPGNQLDNLDRDAPAVPVELEAQVNGVLWRLLVERIGTDRRFGQHRLSISGRGIAAELADPIYPAESRDNTAGAMTAQQLADAALTSNGVPLGWTLDWQIADWLVPAGAWVHTGTPMDAVTRIASAAGGYVQADPLTRTLHVLPRYPLLPWEWSTATPGLILPSAVTTREAVEYLGMPEYNRVYVSGGDIGGVLGQVTIAGSAGDLPAEMVVDALITHVDAVRGRGTAILGNTGRQQRMTLETPILPDVGLYTVGTLLEWQEGADTRRGLVRAVGVSAAHPRVRQSIEVECHG